MIIYSNIDLKQNQIQNIVVHIVATVAAISSPTAGQIVYETSTTSLKYFNGVSWVTSGTGGGGTYTASLPLEIDVGNNITINAATTSDPGSMSAADKTKLDNATATPGANVLALYDAGGRLSTALPTGSTHAANKDYVDTQIANAIDPIGRFVGTFDFGGNVVPTTGFGGGTIANGDYWIASGASTIPVPNVSPSVVIEIGDMVVADGAGNFYGIQKNISVNPGVAKHVDSRSYTNAVTETITHGLNTEDVVVQVYDATTKELIVANVEVITVDTVEITITGDGLPKSFKTVVLG